MANEIFISYSSIKDLDSSVSEMLKYLENAIQQRTNPSVSIFLDKRNIRAGNDWKGNLSDALNKAKILLVLLSPSWLYSEWCRGEYSYFQSLKNDKSTQRTILPLTWIKTTALDAGRDEVKKTIINELNALQQIDWTGLKNDTDFRHSIILRTAIGNLADEIVNYLNETVQNSENNTGQQHRFTPVAASTKNDPRKRIQQTTILTRFIPTWLMAENQFEKIETDINNDELKLIKNELFQFIKDSISDHWSAEFFRTQYDALPEIENMLTDFRIKIKEYFNDLEETFSLDDEAIKFTWKALLKSELFEIRKAAVRINDRAKEIFDESIAMPG